MKSIVAALAAAALLSCARPKPGDIPQVELGSDACARCGMIVSDSRFLAGYVDIAGRSIVYDDLGEFLAAVEDKPELKRSAFVHDVETGRWLPARDAIFVRVEGLPTPMGSGYAAFADQAGAKRFLERQRAAAGPGRPRPKA